MTISATSQGLKPGVCTSTNRPANPFDGQIIYMTDVDQTAVWDGSQWTVLAPIAGGRNRIMNGDFRINQRGFTSATTSGFTHDRWIGGVSGDGTTTHSVQNFTLGNSIAGQEPEKYHRTVTTGQTSAAVESFIWQNIENVRTLAGQTAVLSFWARSNSGTPSVAIEIQQYFGTGGSPSAIVSTPIGKIVLSTTWTRYSTTIAVPSISGKTIGTDRGDHLRLFMYVSAGSNFNTRTGSLGIQSNTFEFWGIQLEAGAVATPFEFEDIGTTLSKCQRYYENSYNDGVAVGTLTTTGSTSVIFSSVSGAATGFNFKVRKRATPAVRGYPYLAGTNNGVGYWTSAGDATNRAVTFGHISQNGMRYIQLTSSPTNSWYEGHYEAESEL
jgi:hypothetical protein